MGPYCNYCQQRCFQHVPADTPEDMLAVYQARFNGDVPIIATCPAGQEFERQRIGFSLDDITGAVTARRTGQRLAWAVRVNPRLDAAGNAPRDPGDENAGWREAYRDDVTALKAIQQDLFVLAEQLADLCPRISDDDPIAPAIRDALRQLPVIQRRAGRGAIRAVVAAPTA